MALILRRVIVALNFAVEDSSQKLSVGYKKVFRCTPDRDFLLRKVNGSIQSSRFCDFSTSTGRKERPLENLSQTDLLGELENALRDHKVGEAWGTFNRYKKLYGFPEISTVSMLITESSYSSDAHWLQKACDLVFSHSKSKLVHFRMESLAKLALSMARAQMPVPASKILMLLLEKGCMPPMNVLRLVILHMVQSDIGTHIASNFLIRICASNKIIPDTMIFNLILDGCVRFGSSLKGQELIELMAQSRVIADSSSLVIIAQIHEKNGQKYELMKYKDYVDRVPLPLLRHYRQFYDSLLSLHFKFDDIDGAVELVGDIYKTREHVLGKDEVKNHFVPIGSHNLKCGLKILVAPEKVDDTCSVTVENKEQYVVFRNNRLGLSDLALAKFMYGFRKNGRINDLSKLLLTIREHIELLDVISGCICLGWLETAHDILEDFEFTGCPIDSVAYFALLEAYNKGGMVKEAKALERQIEKSGSMSNSSSHRGILCTKSSATVGKWGVDQVFIQVIGQEEKAIPSTVYEVNSSIYFFCKAKMIEDAVKTYRRMQEMSLEPNEQTYALLLSGYSSLQMYREVTHLWGDIKRKLVCRNVQISRDLCESLVLNFIRGGYFERVMEVIAFMEENRMYADRSMYRWEFLKLHKNLYRNLKASEASTEAQRKRLDFVTQFRKWVGTH